MKITKFIPDSVVIDSQQLELINKLEYIKKELQRSSFAKLLKKNKYEGCYIFGDVGRGKTLIVKAFYESIIITKSWYHYQEFIKSIHERSHKLFIQKVKEPVSIIAKELASKCKLLCIDELEIRDITDAMLIQRLCEELTNQNVFIVFTSNIEPKNLYKDGLHRELFFKFINQVQENYFIHKLNGIKDYRFEKISNSKNLILHPANAENKALFEEMLSALTHNKHFTADKIIVFNREVEFSKTFNKVLYTNYNEIFDRELSYNDYLTISQRYEAIILDKIEALTNQSDIIIRFINFIDNIYANKVMLLALFNTDLEKLYTGSKYQNEFKRAISRLTEMNSHKYIISTKYYRKNEE